jgi:hypothetical protein
LAGLSVVPFPESTGGLICNPDAFVGAGAKVGGEAASVAFVGRNDKGVVTFVAPIEKGNVSKGVERVIALFAAGGRVVLDCVVLLVGTDTTGLVGAVVLFVAAGMDAFNCTVLSDVIATNGVVGAIVPFVAADKVAMLLDGGATVVVVDAGGGGAVVVVVGRQVDIPRGMQASAALTIALPTIVPNTIPFDKGCWLVDFDFFFIEEALRPLD